MWNYSFSDPANIYLFKFTNNNRRLKCESSSELTIEGPDFVLVSFLLTLNIFGLFLVGMFCWVWTCKCHGILYCLHLNSSMCFMFASRSPVTLKTKLFLATVNKSLQLVPIFHHKELHLRCCKILKSIGGHHPWWSATLGKYKKLTFLYALKIHIQGFFALNSFFAFNANWTE